MSQGSCVRAHKVQKLKPKLRSRTTRYHTAGVTKTKIVYVQDPALGGGAGETTEVAVRVRFSEDRNFEPPQGSLEVIEVGRQQSSRALPKCSGSLLYIG